MRARLLVLATLFATGCGPGSPLVGTWRYALEMSVPTATGPMTKRVTFDLDLAATAAADLVVWRIGGGCNVALPVVGKIAMLTTAPPLCGMSAGAQIPLIGDTGFVVKAGDQLGVSAARFEVLDDGGLATVFDYKLFTDLKDSRVGPVFQLTTPAGKHGTKLK
jgi:hypothetical protein